jgi:alanine-synthesizing transaminase
VRFSLIENEQRTRQAIRSIREMFRRDKVLDGLRAHQA